MGILEDTKALDLMLENPAYTLTENEFVNKWLPLFHGTFKKNDTSPIGLWVMYVCNNSVNVEVDIIDSAGEKLYRIPSLFHEYSSRRKPDLPSANAIMSQAALMDKAFPRKGNKLRTQGVSLILKNETKEDISALTFWNELFVRYGLTEIEVPDNVKGLLGKSTASEDEYDDDEPL